MGDTESLNSVYSIVYRESGSSLHKPPDYTNNGLVRYMLISFTAKLRVLVPFLKCVIKVAYKFDVFDISRDDIAVLMRDIFGCMMISIARFSYF